MVFSDLHFIYLFLPIALLIYYLVPFRAKNAVLFLSSMVFYFCGTLDQPLYMFLLFSAVVVTYLCGRAMRNYPKFKKPIFVFSLVYHFGLLFLFKYADFFFQNINPLLKGIGLTVELPELLLPIGISFYTFQAVSYLADVYTGTIQESRSFIDFGTYLSMFPQLIAGPIVQYKDISCELQKRTIDFASFSDGLKTFVLGMGLKVILANNLGLLWRDVAETIGFESVTAPLAWLAVIGYSLQLYFDFYGYSLMAQGMGRMLGFTIPDNFRHPYISVSMTEFWRRWHITLGTWFRSYVYIPLGGSRRGNARRVLNLLIVWLFTGLWHGAGWNFLIWGLFLFVVLVIEKAGLLHFMEKHRVIGHLYMLFLISVSWAIFAVTDMEQLKLLFSHLFPFFSSAQPLRPGDWLDYVRQYGILLSAGIVLSLPFGRKLYDRYKNSPVCALVLAAIFGYSLYWLLKGLNNPFLYFRF